MLRSAPLRRLTPLRSKVGLRRKGQTYTERRWRDAVIERDRSCRFPGCKRTDSLEAHHVASRAQRPDLRLDIANGVAVCHAHHHWLTDHPIEGAELGLVSHERYEARHRGSPDA